MDYLRLLRSAPTLLVVLEADAAYTIVDASDAYLAATGARREGIVGRGFFEVFPGHPTERGQVAREHLRASFERVRATGEIDPLPPVQRYDLQGTAGDGAFEERWWTAVNAPVRDAAGRVAAIIHSVEDATEVGRLRRAERRDRAKLEEANRLFQAIYDQGIFAGRIDLDGVLVDANRSSLEQCGFTREEVIGKPFWECGWWNRTPEVRAWARHAVETALGGEPFRGTGRYFVADGSERVVEFACMPIKDEAGRVRFVVPTGIDVTERERGARELRATEILDSITEGFFALDRDWRFTYLNREGRRILGVETEYLRGRSLWEVYPGLAGTEFERAYRAAMDERTPSSVTAFYPDHQRWYEAHVYPSAEGVSIYFRNVTAQKESEAERERLAAESDRQRRIYEVALSNTPDLVYVFDLRHRFMYANEALLAIWGMTREQALGKTCLELGYPDWEAEMHDREIDQVIATRRPIQGEVPFEGATGRRYWDYIFAPVLGPDGEVVAIAGTARDTTDRRLAEEEIAEKSVRLQEADRAKDEFIATLSHELRNPLAPLRNAVALLRMNARVDERTAAIHQMMGRQVDHLVRLVDDLLEIARVTRGDFALRRERVSLSQVVRNGLETSEPAVRARGHEVTVTMPEESVWVDADPVRLAQVVANLVDNAAKYTPEGGRIEVSLERTPTEATVRVRDNGAGIAADALPRIFEMFDRGGREQLRGEGGLGIGLALARRLAEMHGATLAVASEGIGRGSEFTLRMPLAADAAPSPVERPAPATMASTRVLVVDDNADAAESLAMILRELGADVLVAHGGAEALEAFGPYDPAAVLLDIGMPGMSGYEVARALRERFPASHARLIALTGWGQEQDRERARQAGFHHHLVKPAELQALQDLLASIPLPAAAAH